MQIDTYIVTIAEDQTEMDESDEPDLIESLSIDKNNILSAKE